MNTLLFLCGAGVGALVTIVIILIFLSIAMRRRKESDDRTIELMKERNALDQSKVRYLKVLSDWAEQNWNNRSMERRG